MNISQEQHTKALSHLPSCLAASQNRFALRTRRRCTHDSNTHTEVITWHYVPAPKFGSRGRCADSYCSSLTGEHACPSTQRCSAHQAPQPSAESSLRRILCGSPQCPYSMPSSSALDAPTACYRPPDYSRSIVLPKIAELSSDLKRACAMCSQCNSSGSWHGALTPSHLLRVRTLKTSRLRALLHQQ